MLSPVGPLARIACVLLLAALARPARAQEPAGADLPGLIARAEPAVACLLVSRSPWYREFGLSPAEARPGRLGGVSSTDLLRAAQRLGLGPDEEERRRKLDARLDLANPLHHPEAFGTGLVV